MNNIQNYIEKKNGIQQNIIEFLDGENTDDFYLYQLNIYLKNENIIENHNEFKSLLHLISKISTNHHRTRTFFNKIEQILSLFKNEIRKSFSNSQIFSIFKKNKRIILFLIEEGILKPDTYIANQMMSEKYFNSKYPIYFYLEFQHFFDNKEEILKNKIDEINQNDIEQFKLKRKIGENHHQECELIRNDSIEEFVSFSNRINLNLSKTIESSIYETNSFLIKNNPTLIEYSAFFGSIQIFKYLMMNHVELTSSLWIYSIHGKNPDIIHILEDNHVIPHDSSFKECLVESIKCHHNEITDYILDNLLTINYKDDSIIYSNAIRYNNYAFFPDKISNLYFLDELCKFNYVSIVNLLINNKNINSKIILNKTIFINKISN